MSGEARRQKRVQGAWANNRAGAAVKATGKPSGVSATKNTSLSTATSWQSKGSAVDGAALTFQHQEVMAKPEVRVINDAGTFDISTGPSGISRLRLIPGFIEPAECDVLLQKLLSELPWQQETVVRPGEVYVQPRMTAWFGDLPYAYSGITHPTNNKWLPVLLDLKARIEANTQLTFNSLLANLYRDGHDHVAWHSDDESSLGPDPVIASLSFGDTRNFELRKKLPPDAVSDAYTEYVKVPLDPGTLLIMDGTLQRDWEHRVPREYHDRTARVNLTYRTILPE